MGRDQPQQLLQTHALILRQKRSVPKTTNSAPSLRKYPNLLLDRTLTATQQAWGCDIAYLCIGLGFGDLSLLTDAYSKRIVGCCLHPLLTVQGSLNALEMALEREQPRSDLLIHPSDRGSQYGSFAYIQRLRQAGIASSVTQHGAPYENAVAERVNGILKTDFRLNRGFTTFEEAVRAVEQRVPNSNRLRPHMSCG